MYRRKEKTSYNADVFLLPTRNHHSKRFGRLVVVFLTTFIFIFEAKISSSSSSWSSPLSFFELSTRRRRRSGHTRQQFFYCHAAFVHDNNINGRRTGTIATSYHSLRRHQRRDDNFHQYNQYQQQQRLQRMIWISSSLSSSSSTTALSTKSSSSTSSSHRTKLEKYTIKQLKALIKDNDLHKDEPKGFWSRVTKKQDLINFVINKAKERGSSATGTTRTVTAQHHSTDNRQRHATTTQVKKEEQHQAKQTEGTPSALNGDTRTKKTVTMKILGVGNQRQQQQQRSNTPRRPPMPSLDTGSSDDVSNNYQKTKTKSPRDTFFDEIRDMYPPLKNRNNGNKHYDDDDEKECTDSEGNYVDIRQQYHPMLKNIGKKQSDMDVIFLGTASCIPGVTRGVSCTALRLSTQNRIEKVDVPKEYYDSIKDEFGNNNNGIIQTKQQDQQEQSGGSNNKSPSMASEIWLFDVGESTQIQIQKTSIVKPNKVTKIFVTHAHGDHTFGLPGLLCSIGRSRSLDDPPIEIYGPEGLRLWLRIAIRYSVSRIVPPYRVHEIMDIPMAYEWYHNKHNNKYYYHNGSLRQKQQQGRQSNGAVQPATNTRMWGEKGLAGEDPTSWITASSKLGTNGEIALEPSIQFGEIDGGRSIYPIYDHPLCSDDGAPVWEISGHDNEIAGEDNGNVKVYAGPMSHGVPCVGYVVNEPTRPGKLQADKVQHIVQRNLHDLKHKFGFRVPMKVMSVLKNMKPGESFTFPDGTVVHQKDVVEEPKRGRKVVIGGDTTDSRGLENLAMNCDVLVHEATNTFLPGIDNGLVDGSGNKNNIQLVTRDTIVHGHSTPYMAGEFAKRINAKNLVLNHFSSRYKGDASLESISLMTKIEKQAIQSSGLSEINVAASWDLMFLPILPPE